MKTRENLMQFQNKNKIAYLGALTLLFSYAEMIFPKILPFFRLGLGNIAILLAFDLSFPSFLLLTLIKALASSIMSGTLLSPFFIISLSQSFFSGISMYLLARLNQVCKNKLFSIYGISIFGSALSALIQILLSSIYLGKGTLALLGLMLLFSIFSGILTAFLSQILHIPSQAPVLIRNMGGQTPKKSITPLLILLILSASICIFLNNNLIFLIIVFFLSFFFQKISGRKIYLLPHISLWLFIMITSLVVPNGQVLLSIGKFSVTKGALLQALIKSLKLSSVSALSQCAANFKPQGDRPLALVLSYFRGLSNIFRNTEGNFLFKLKTALQATEIQDLDN